MNVSDLKYHSFPNYSLQMFMGTSYVDFTCLDCLSQTHFASTVGHESVDPKRGTCSSMEKGFM